MFHVRQLISWGNVTVHRRGGLELEETVSINKGVDSNLLPWHQQLRYSKLYSFVETVRWKDISTSQLALVSDKIQHYKPVEHLKLCYQTKRPT